jgi:hypothetical protein
MTIMQKGIVAASFAAMLTVSATAMAAPPGKADYNADPAAENSVRYGWGYGYSYGYRNPYAAHPEVLRGYAPGYYGGYAPTGYYEYEGLYGY